MLPETADGLPLTTPAGPNLHESWSAEAIHVKCRSHVRFFFVLRGLADAFCISLIFDDTFRTQLAVRSFGQLVFWYTGRMSPRGCNIGPASKTGHRWCFSDRDLEFGPEEIWGKRRHISYSILSIIPWEYVTLLAKILTKIWAFWWKPELHEYPSAGWGIYWRKYRS